MTRPVGAGLALPCCRFLQGRAGQALPLRHGAAWGLLLLTGCAHHAAPAAKEKADTPAALPAVQVVPVRRGTIEQTLPVSGTLMALRTQEATVMPPVAGVLDALPVHFGQTVQKGQIIAQLSTAALDGQIRQAQATLGQNRVQVQQAQVNALQQQAQTRTAIAQAEAALSGAQANLSGTRATLAGNEAALQNAQQSLARQQTLLANGLVAQKDVEAAQLAVRTADAQVQAQRQAVAAQEQTVSGQRHAVEAARAASLQDVVKREDIAVARQQMHNAEGALQTAQAQRALLTIRAPLTGQITTIGATVGETVDTTTKLATLANLSVMQLQMAVPGERARAIHAGQSVSFHLEGQAGKVYSAQVKSVGTAVDPASNTVPVLALVPNSRRAFRDDSPARAEIVLARHTDALLVPQAAVLFDADGKASIVTVGADGVAHVKEVKAGLAQNGLREMTAGAAAGERVAVSGNYGLPDGTKVSVAPNVKGTP